MKLGFLFVSALALSGAFAMACSATVTTVHDTADGGPTDTDGSTDPNAPDSDDPANQPPHSLGTIVLGESHASGASKSTPIVSASFLPDAAAVPYCKTKLDSGCTIQKAPQCTQDMTTGTGCKTGSYCTLDTSCSSVCKVSPVCAESCADDEVCTAGTGTSTAGTCQKTQSFDAGPIAFSGTTTAITLYPPYAYMGDGSGAPFLAGADIHVQASGAVSAGFNAFDESFKATTFLQTTTALNKIPRETVFGTGAVPVSWVPGTDTIIISLSGPGGSAECKVDDAAGTFQIPRTVVKAALGDGTTTTTSTTASLSMSVTRAHIDTMKDQTAKGTLTGVTVQPVGWLQLSTHSTESTSFEGCSGTASICGDACADLQTDTANCGACDNACQSGQVCAAGKCGGSDAACQTCVSNAQSGTCASALSACENDVSCSTLLTCLSKCSDATCENTCETTTPAGETKLTPYVNCINSACSASCN